MAIQEFDQLNNSIRQRFDDYFSVMQIPKESHEQRVDMAMEFWESWLFFLALMSEMESYSNANQTALQTSLQQEVLARVGTDTMLEDATFLRIIQDGVQSIVNTTLQHNGVAYYTSNDRGEHIAEDMSNRVCSYQEFSEAIKSGKTMKTWNTMEDASVRFSHNLVEGTTIPIDSLFEVGDSLMAYPTDETHVASQEQICNCRCWLTYK